MTNNIRPRHSDGEIMVKRHNLTYRILVVGRGVATVSGYGKKHNFFTKFQQTAIFFFAI